SASCASAFTKGLNTFLREAELLSRLDHPSLARVTRLWEANDTAYSMMPFYAGQSLAAELQAMGHPPDEAWLRAMLFGVLGALQTLHAVSWQHLNLSPSSILLRKDGRPVLLGLGGVRRAIDTKNRQTPVKPQPGPMDYAPLELQSGRTDPAQFGPWTDLYSLAAVVHEAIIGRPPLPAMLRAAGDRMAPLSVSVKTLSSALPGLRYSTEFLAALDRALAVNPAQRLHSVAAFQLALEPHTALSAEAPAASLFSAASASGQADSGLAFGAAQTPQFHPPSADLDRSLRGWRWVAVVLVLGAVGAAAWYWISSINNEPAQQTMALPAPQAAQPTPRASEPASGAQAPAASAAVPAPSSAPQAASASAAPASASVLAVKPAPVTAAAPAAATVVAPPARAAMAAAAPASAAAPVADEAADEGRMTTTKEFVSTPVKPPESVVSRSKRPAPAVPENPRAMCSGRSNFSLVYCMQTQCKQPKFSHHAQCEELRKHGGVN
ncbi:MAG TPA: protein kinase, partial [Rhizobacter sp.]|nr:protein kinase [Rhizobacter sp.]